MAKDMLDNLDQEYTDVETLEAITDTLIKETKALHLLNSRTYQVKIKPKEATWRDSRVKPQIKARDRAQKAHKRNPNQHPKSFG